MQGCENENKVKKVAMTGGSGPIGLALIRKLLAENIEILLFQRENSANKIYLPKHELLHIEYYSLEEIKDYIPKHHDYDVFFHLGWANTNRTMRDNLEIQNKNVLFSCEAVELAYRLGCHTFIGTGSQAEYGRHTEALTPNTICRPENAYGIMKLCACYSTKNLCKKYNIRHIWTRVLSGYGIYDNIGSVLISTILKNIEGQKLEFSKGEQIWDFVYLDDIANALFLIAQKGKDNAIYPIGSGDARPLKEYLSILCEKMGTLEKAEWGKLPYAKNQIMHLEADISKIQEDTGWFPETTFEEGIERTIEFYKDWKITWEDNFWDCYKKYQKTW